MLVRRIPRIIFDKRAVNNVISATILTSVVIALSLSVFAWAQSRSLEKKSEISETVDTETAKLKEDLAFEYVCYEDNPSNKLSVYLLNCGSIDGIQIKTVYIYDSSNTLLETFPTPTLMFLNGTEIPDQDLDVGEEGYFVELSTSLEEDAYYCVKVVTVRGRIFAEGFVA